MRWLIPEGFSNWWDEDHLPRQRSMLNIKLKWRGDNELTVGTLHRDSGGFRFSPDPADFTGDGAERVGRLIAKALTRAGWLRPRLDPDALLHLIEVQSRPIRVEFILDTNAMVEGIGHWLADHFADRCDLVVTAVTLRELQDLKGRSRLGTELPEAKEANNRANVLGARQAYLAASRFREQVGYDRVLWRELELDDTALLLSRGPASDKSSESDTLLLRAVRRSIHARVNGLERFFVTGDTALARRATTELPVGSVIAAQVRELETGEILFPCGWWPGPDQGYRVARHASRLIWELLCIGDEVELGAEDGRTWTFRAFDNPMWPSDYLNPWIDVAQRSSPNKVAGEKAETSNGPPQIPRDEPGEPANAPSFISSEVPTSSVWRPVPKGVVRLDGNLRLSAEGTLHVLASLVSGGDEEFRLPTDVRNEEVRRHLCVLLKELDLADVDRGTWTARPLAHRAELVEAWRNNDHDALFDLLRAWLPMEEWATMDDPPNRPKKTQGSARALVALLSQGLFVDGQWYPGGRRPGLDVIRKAVIGAVPKGPERAIPIYTLLVDVFLKRLKVAPARVVRVWDALWANGVFEGFEARQGGSSSGQRFQEIARFSANGWERERIDLESYDGVRDLLHRRQS